MKENRIAGYMALTTFCTFVCCAAAAYLLLVNAVNFFSIFEELLRPAVNVLAVIVVLRHFIVFYRLRLENARLWAKIAGSLLFPALLLALLYVYAELCRFTAVNCGLWHEMIPFTKFLTQQAMGSQIRWQDWILPSAALAALEGLYLFVYATPFGRRIIMPAWSLPDLSPFLADESELLRDADRMPEDVSGKPKKTVVLQLVRDESATGGDDDK